MSPGRDSLLETKKARCKIDLEYLSVPVFYAFTITIAYFGLSGIHELYNISPCSKITPAYSPTADVALTSVLNGCLQYFARLDSKAPQYCASYSILQIENAGADMDRRLQAYSLPPIAQTAYDQCLRYIPMAEQGLISYDQLKTYSVEFALREFPATASLGEQAVNQYQQCVQINPIPSGGNVAAQNRLLTCVKERLTPLLGEKNVTVISHSCIGPVTLMAPTVNTNTLEARSNISLAIDPNAAEQAVVQAVQQCAYTVLAGLGGNPLYLQATQLVQLVRRGLQQASADKVALSDSCLGDALSDPVSASRCVVQAGMSLEDISRPLCEDLLQAGLGGDVGASLGQYYNSVAAKVWVHKDELLTLLLEAVGVSLVCAVCVLAVVGSYAALLCRWVIKVAIAAKAVSTILQFAVGNIPGGAISLVFLLAKALFFWLIRHRIEYIGVILSTSLSALKCVTHGMSYM